MVAGPGNAISRPEQVQVRPLPLSTNGDKMDKELLTIQLSAGTIKRYHTLQVTGENTVGLHTYGVCQILRYITNDEWDPVLMKAALDHDVGEYFIGDTPHPVKVNYPNLYDVLHRIEEIVADQYGFKHGLRYEEKILLRAADLLEMGYFGLHQRTLGNNNGVHIVANVLTALEQLPEIENQTYKELMKDIRRQLNASE